MSAEEIVRRVVPAVHALLGAGKRKARIARVRLAFIGTESRPASDHESWQRPGLEALLSGAGAEHHREMAVLRIAWREDWRATRDAILLGIASLPKRS